VPFVEESENGRDNIGICEIKVTIKDRLRGKKKEICQGNKCEENTGIGVRRQ
jgi:hypothetical protein